MPSGFVYILASRRNGTLYIGVTSDLLGRMEQHREGIGSAFVKKYGVCRLVHFEEYPLYTDAMRRETSLKRWKRAWKLALIEKHNRNGSIYSNIGIGSPWMAGSEAGHGEGLEGSAS
jgi:putative endonuclease